ncbi:MAG: 3-deoxy-D-manno-octulosonic acid transferase [Pseudomonadota bacterium]
MGRLLYTLLLTLLLPLVSIWMKWRGWRNPAHRGSLRQRLALGLQQRGDRPLWLHAASVGEVQSLAGLVRLLLREQPSQPLVITVGSPTGVARAAALFAESPHVAVSLAPFDLPGVARRFLAANRPRYGAIVETEIWPNMIAVATRCGVPLSMVSARVSQRSTTRYLRYAPGLVRRTLVKFRNIGAQSEADRQRFIQLGADPSRLQVIGNLKFDFPLPQGIAQKGMDLRACYAPHRPMWVAGSTHPGEEEVCIAAQQDLVKRAGSAATVAPLLVLAPRRAERFDEVASWLTGLGISFVRSSRAADGRGAQMEGQVLLVDTLGELLAFYAAGDVAFVGGSLVPVGGHNLLEPAALGKPTVTGPHSFNSPEAARLLEAAGGLTRVTDATTLADAIHGLLTDPVSAKAQGQRAAAAVVANQGAAARALALLA